MASRVLLIWLLTVLLSLTSTLAQMTACKLCLFSAGLSAGFNLTGNTSGSNPDSNVRTTDLV